MKKLLTILFLSITALSFGQAKIVVKSGGGGSIDPAVLNAKLDITKKPIVTTAAGLRTATNIATDVVYVTTDNGGGQWKYNPANTTGVDNGITIVKSGANVFERIFSGPIDATWAGLNVANANNVTELRAAARECQRTGKELYIPPGADYYINDSIIFTGTYNIRCEGDLYYTGPVRQYPIIRVGTNTTTNSRNYYFNKIHANPTVSTDTLYTGIEFRNVANSDISVKSIEHFNTGIVFNAVNGGFVAYNTVQLPGIASPIDAVKLIADSLGFNNQNTFFDGGPNAIKSGGRGIVIQGSQQGSNTFNRTAIEGSPLALYGIYLSGNTAGNAFTGIRSDNFGANGTPFVIAVSANTIDNIVIVQNEALTGGASSGISDLSGTGRNKYLSEITFVKQETSGPISIVQTANGTTTTLRMSFFDSGYLKTNRTLYDNGTNVGIGTPNPYAKLHIARGGDNGYKKVYTATSVIEGLMFDSYFASNNSSRRYSDIIGIGNADGATGGGVLRFITNSQLSLTGAERMRIERSGNVLIGDSTDNGFKLEVTGTSNFTLPVKIADATASFHAASKGQMDAQITGLSTTYLATTGATNYLPKLTATKNTINSLVYDNGASIGIGTETPYSRFHISRGSDNPYPLIYTASGINEGLLLNNYISSLNSSRRYSDIIALGNADGATGGGVLRFITNSQLTFTAAERMRIERSGNLLVGDSTDDLTNIAQFKGTVKVSPATASNQAVNKSQLDSVKAPPVIALTDAATITWNASTTTNRTVTLAGNRTLSITSAVAGQYGTLVVKQDATGSRTLTLPAGSKVSGGAGAVTLTTTANASDILTWYFDGTNYFWNASLNYN